MTPLRIITAGRKDPWRTDTRPMDAGRRLHIFGRVQPMEQQGFLAKLFGARG